jgi:hypothetical protein
LKQYFQRKNTQIEIALITMKFLAAATKNKSGLEFRKLLVENAASCFGKKPNGKAKKLFCS